jgi:hypothetical protein
MQRRRDHPRAGKFQGWRRDHGDALGLDIGHQVSELSRTGEDDPDLLFVRELEGIADGALADRVHHDGRGSIQHRQHRFQPEIDLKPGLTCIPGMLIPAGGLEEFTQFSQAFFVVSPGLSEWCSG